MDRIEEQIDAFLDNQLTKEEEEQLMKELAQSGEARAIMKSATRLKDLIGEARLRFEFPADIDERFLSRLSGERERARDKGRFFKHRASPSRAARLSFAAFAIFLLGASFLLFTFIGDKARDTKSKYKIGFFQVDPVSKRISWGGISPEPTKLREFHEFHFFPLRMSDGSRFLMIASGFAGGLELASAAQGTLLPFTRPFLDTTTTVGLFPVEEMRGILTVFIGARVDIGLGHDQEGNIHTKTYYLGDTLAVQLASTIPLNMIKKVYPDQNLYLYITKDTKEQEEFEREALEQGTMNFDGIVEAARSIRGDQPRIELRATFARTDTTGSVIVVEKEFQEPINVRRIYRYHPFPEAAELPAAAYLLTCRAPISSLEGEMMRGTDLYVVPVAQNGDSTEVRIFGEIVYYQHKKGTLKRAGSVAWRDLGTYWMRRDKPLELDLPVEPRDFIRDPVSKSGTVWYRLFQHVYREKVRISLR